MLTKILVVVAVLHLVADVVIVGFLWWWGREARKDREAADRIEFGDE